MPCFARLIRLACLVFVPTTTSNMNPTVIKNANVFLLGLAFMLMFTAFQTMGNIQTTILNSARNPNSTGYVPGFDGVGYTSLAIIYGVFSASNWIAPSVVAVLGPRLTMFVGGLTYASFIAQFFQPNTYALYFLSALLGVGAAIIWTGQGNFLSLNSDDRTMSRNSGIFWAMLQCSMVIGNTFVFFEFQGLTDIDKHTRTVVVIVLLSVCCVGVLTLVLLRPVPQMEEEELLAGGSQASETPMQALKGAWKLFITPDMLLLSVLFFYTGLELTFWSGVYGPSIGSTLAFGVAAKSLVGMHGIFVGVGESLGGLVFGIFGSQLVKRGRDPVVMLGFVIHAAAAFGVFLNLPNSAPLGDTNGKVVSKCHYYANFAVHVIPFRCRFHTCKPVFGHSLLLSLRLRRRLLQHANLLHPGLGLQGEVECGIRHF